MATNDGGRSGASRHCKKELYEIPSVPTLPVEPGSLAAHSTVLQQSFGGVARMLGPLWAGAAFQHLGIATPFWLAAGLMLLVHAFAVYVKEEGEPPPEEDVGEVVLPADPS